MDRIGLQIGEAAGLTVTPKHLRLLEREGRVPPAHRGLNGRIYTPFDITLLRSMGVSTRPRRLRTVEEVLGGSIGKLQ